MEEEKIKIEKKKIQKLNETKKNNDVQKIGRIRVLVKKEKIIEKKKKVLKKEESILYFLFCLQCSCPCL
jgi:hypothetical protein